MLLCDPAFWSDNASTIAHHRAVLNHCLDRIAKRQLMAGWYRWHEQWKTATRNRSLLAKVGPAGVAGLRGLEVRRLTPSVDPYMPVSAR